MSDPSAPGSQIPTATVNGLNDSEANFRTLVENIPQRVFFKDRQSRYLAVNRHYAVDLGLAPDDMVGRDDYAFHPRELADKYRADDQRVMETGLPDECDESYARDGREYTIHTVKTPVRDDSGQIVGVCGIFWDVTEQRRLEARLRDSEATLRAIYEHAREGILVASAETRRFVMANPAICRMLGYSEPELLGMSPEDLHTPEVLPRVREIFQAMERGDFIPHQIPFLRKDGTLFHADASATLVTIQGRPCFFGVFRDITDLLSSQEALARGEALLTEAQALAHVGNWNLDLATGQATWSEEEYRLLGYVPGEVNASVENFLRAVHLDDREAVQAEMQRAMTPVETRPYHMEHRVLRPDGEHFVEQQGRMVFDADGTPLRMYGTTLDVTEKRKVEQALRRSEETYSSAEAIAHIGSWDLDIPTGMLRWTDEVFRIFGHPPQSFVATHEAFMDAVHPEDRGKVIEAVNASLAEGGAPYNVQHRVVRPDGTLRVVQERAKVYRDEHGTPVRMIGSVHDITEQKAAEMELARYREHLEDLVRERTAEVERASRRNAIIVHAAMDGFFTASLAGRLIDCNEAYCRMLGYTREEMLQLHLRDIEADETPEEMAAHVRRIGEQGRDRFDTRHRRKDGGLVHVEVNVALATIGEEQHFFAFVHNITDRKAYEAALMLSRDEAERANRAKSLFLTRMSHELRTPLNAILGFGQLLESDPEHPIQAAQRESVGEILHAGRHLLEMINEMLDLARIEAGRLSVSLAPVDVWPLLRECRALVAPLAEARGIRVMEDSSSAWGGVLADGTRLKQVLINLLSNAVKYNRDQGSVSVSCDRVGDRVRICVTDTGRGLTPEQQGRLFSPFERLDADTSAIEGTGIGLALSKRLTELMRGEIGVESTPGVGSIFWVEFPAAESVISGRHVSGDPAAEAAGTSRRTVLYIEDNPANLRLMARILSKREDIRLISAERSGIGLELAAAHRPDLILLDINLPDMDGYQVLSRLRGNPETRAMPVIGIGANAMPRDVEKARAAGFAGYLTKPLDIGQLLRTVDSTLSTSPSEGRE